jgi:hypothetical protein
MLKSLLKFLLILVIFVPFAMVMPLASFWLCRTPEGAQVVFWAAPWSACFWALIAHVFVGSRFWRGRESVLAWRSERGGYLRSSIRSTMVMFGALFASYALELAVVLLLPPSDIARQLFPAVTYAPAAFVLWRAARG